MELNPNNENARLNVYIATRVILNKLFFEKERSETFFNCLLQQKSTNDVYFLQGFKWWADTFSYKSIW